MPDLVFTRRAREDLRRLPESVKIAVANVLGRLELDPRKAGVPLVGRLRGLWSARVGNYRVVYTIEGTSPHERIIVRAVRHRVIAYGRRRRR